MVKTKLPRVLVGAPIHEVKQYCIDQYINNTLDIDYDNFDIYLVDNSQTKHFAKELRKTYPQISIERLPYASENYDRRGAIHRRIIGSCNMIRERVLASDYDYYLSLECDVLIPRDGLKKLIKDKKPIVSGLAYRGFYPDVFWQQKNLVVRDSGTLGCTLISRELLEKFAFRLDLNLLGAFHDALLIYDIHQAGYNFWLDKSVRCVHLAKDSSGADRGWGGLPNSEKQS